MTNKKLRITEEAYKILVESKNPEESLSDYILRKYNKRNNQIKGLKVETY